MDFISSVVRFEHLGGSIGLIIQLWVRYIKD